MGGMLRSQGQCPYLLRALLEGMGASKEVHAGCSYGGHAGSLWILGPPHMGSSPCLAVRWPCGPLLP